MEELDQITGIARHILSKSTFMYGCQCPKRLWLHKFQPEARDEIDERQSAIFQSGTDIGLLAQQLFPGGVNAAPLSPFEYQQSVADTRKYIREGRRIIYEAAFQYGEILCAIDILVKQTDGWLAYEVKSSARVKPPFIQDAALQYYVMTHSGLALNDIFVTHLNTKYVRYRELDLKQLFTSVSVKKDVIELQPFIAAKANELKNVLQLREVPVVEMGDHCSRPYSCDFQGFCSIGMPEGDAEEKHINQIAIREFLDTLRYPLYFLDFETWMTAIPEYDGHWPYRQIPFQFSLHKQSHRGGLLEHVYYLADETNNSLTGFAESLFNNLGSKGSVIVYNKNFENMILNHLKIEFPRLRRRIGNVQDRMIDLMAPFRKNYRLPEMNWSYSIKHVLPALVPELSYDKLSIANGTDASTAFYNLKYETNEEKRKATRASLLEYCYLDTLAMVKILEKLEIASAESRAGDSSRTQQW